MSQDDDTYNERFYPQIDPKFYLKIKELLKKNPRMLYSANVSEGLLRDAFPDNRREVFILVTAVKAGLIGNLITQKNDHETIGLAIESAIGVLTRDYAFDQTTSRWALATWSSAMDIDQRNLFDKSSISRDVEKDFAKRSTYETGRSLRLSIAWKINVGIDSGFFGHAPVISSDNLVLYIGSPNRYLYAVNAESGELIWKFLSDERIDGSPTLSRNNGIIYFAARNHVYALDAKNGGLIWKKGIAINTFSIPVLSSDEAILYVGSIYKGLYAFDSSNGRKLWRAKSSGGIISTPAITSSGSTIFFGSEHGDLYSVESRKGKRLWRHRTDKPIYSSPVISSDNHYVYFGGLDDKLHCVDFQNGSMVWEIDLQYIVISSPKLSSDDKVVYVGGADGIFYAIDARDGSEIWHFHVGHRVDSTPFLEHADNQIIFGAADNKLYLLDALTGEMISSYQVDGIVHSPVCSSLKRVYFGCGDGNLYSLHKSF